MIPARFTLQIKRRAAGAYDAHGNSMESFADPVPWPVHGYSPGANELAAAQNRDLSYILWTVYAPAGGPLPAELDLVTVEGVDYLVDARPADWSHGPWPHPDAGVSVTLKASEG